MDESLASPKAKPAKKCRIQQYKVSTPPWKETYRKRCVARLKGSRERFQNCRRKISGDMSGHESLVNEVMRDEWKSLQREHTGLPAFVDDVTFAFEDDLDDIDTILSIFEEIQRELRLEEQSLLEEYERYEESMKFDDSLLCSAVECLCTEDVVCPVCQKNVLIKNRNVIFCKCGVRIDTEQDCIRMENVQSQIHAGLREHHLRCEETASFSVVQMDSISNLLMTCKLCDFMFIVI